VGIKKGGKNRREGGDFCLEEITKRNPRGASLKVLGVVGVSKSPLFYLYPFWHALPSSTTPINSYPPTPLHFSFLCTKHTHHKNKNRNNKQQQLTTTTTTIIIIIPMKRC
jgi:hypothetical protein